MKRILKLFDNGHIVSSRIIADELGRWHKDVLRDIRNILNNSQLNNLDVESIACLNNCTMKDYLLTDYFIESSYMVEGQKRKYLEYEFTKKGFILYMSLVNGYIDNKIKYIEENVFNHEFEREMRKNGNRNNTTANKTV